jgi:hypothetical protein
MYHARFFSLAALVGTACLAPCGSVLAQNAEPEKRASAVDAPEKLDAFIAEAIKPDAKDTPLRKLQKDLCREQATAIGKIQLAIEFGKASPVDFNRFYTLSARLAEDLMELMDKPESKIKCLEMRVDAFKQQEKAVELRVQTGTEASQEVNLARANRIRAEIKLLKFKSDLEKEKK